MGVSVEVGVAVVSVTVSVLDSTTSVVDWLDILIDCEVEKDGIKLD